MPPPRGVNRQSDRERWQALALEFVAKGTSAPSAGAAPRGRKGVVRPCAGPDITVRIGDPHVPAELFERVMHEPRAGHRLDHRPHRLPTTTDLVSQVPQTVGIWRRRDLIDELAELRIKHTSNRRRQKSSPTCNIDPALLRTEVQSPRPSRYRDPRSAPRDSNAGSRGRYRASLTMRFDGERPPPCAHRPAGGSAPSSHL